MKKIILIKILLIIVSYQNLLSAPAIPNLLEVKQPNGKKFFAYLKGDEFFNWWESKNGDILIRNIETGFLEFAQIKKINNVEFFLTTGIKYFSNKKLPKTFKTISKSQIYNFWKFKIKDAYETKLKILEK